VQADPEFEVMSSKPEWPSSELIFDQWDQAMRFAHDVLLNGKVSERVRFLQDELLAVSDLGSTPSQCVGHALIFCEKKIDLGSRETTDVLALLTGTYPRYADAESRVAVERVGAALAKRDSAVAEQVVVWLDAQSAHASAPGDLYALLCWSCALLPLVIASPPVDDLVRVLASLLDALLGSPRAKPAVRVGAVTRVRRALRGVSCSRSLHRDKNLFSLLDLKRAARCLAPTYKNARHSTARCHYRCDYTS
jgi:hypothetical protein